MIDKAEAILTGEVNEMRHTKHGIMVINPRDVYVGRCLSTYGEYSESETALLLQAAIPGSLVLDIGANIGSHTLPLARAVGNNGVVFAFEPQRHMFQMLCANLAINSIMNVVAIREAVGGADGKTRVPVMNYATDHNFAGLQLGEWPVGEDVRVVAIDSLELAGCSLMKIDVEGWEAEVLRGAAATIERFKPAIYCENNQAGLQGSLIRQLEAMGYECYWHFPTLFSPANYYKKADDVFHGAISQNMFCLHRERKSEMRGFLKAVTDLTGETVYSITPDGKRAIMQATCGQCEVDLPGGVKIRMGGPTGRAEIVKQEPPADSARLVAAKIMERRKNA